MSRSDQFDIRHYGFVISLPNLTAIRSSSSPKFSVNRLGLSHPGGKNHPNHIYPLVPTPSSNDIARVNRGIWVRLGIGAATVTGVANLTIGNAAAALIPPPNDALGAAITVSGPSFRLATDLGGATRESFEVITPVEHGHSAWWAWTAPESGTYGWDSLGSSNRVAVGVFQRDAFGRLQAVASTEVMRIETPNGLFLEPEAKGIFLAEAGEHYLIRLDLTAAYQLPLFIPLPLVEPRPVSVLFQRVTTPAPANDHFAGRLVIPDQGASFTAPLSLATVEPAEPSPAAEVFRHSLWWTWTAPGHGTATIKVRDLVSGAVAGIYTRGLWETLELAATSATMIGNRCYSFSAGHNAVTWHTSPGANFEIQVGRFSTFVSSLPAELELIFTPAPTNDVPEGATILTGVDLSLTVTNRGATRRSHEPVLPGGTGSNSVWFRWSAPARGVLQISPAEPIRYDDPDFKPTTETGVIDTTIDFCTTEHDLNPLPAFVPLFGIFSGEAANGNQPARPSSLLASGTNGAIAEIGAKGDYSIQLDGVQDTAGETPLNLLFYPAPVNEGFSNRISLPAESVRVTGRTFAANPNAGVWWEWHAPSAGRWTFFVSAGEWGNTFVVYRGNATSPENEVQRTQREPLVFTATAGETFQIGVLSNTRFGSSLRFTLTPTLPPLLRLSGLTDYYPLNFRSVRLQLPDNSGLPYLIEQSGDLRQWTPVFTNLNAFSHTVELRDQLGAITSFFRARLAENPSP